MLSCVRGPETPLFEGTISEALAKTTAAYPEHEALVVLHRNQRFTFRELSNLVERTAAGLCSLGLSAGDRVGIWATNCAEWIFVQLACARIGAVLVNVNPAYRAEELRFVLNKSRMRALFLRERDKRSDYASILAEARDGQELALEHTVCFDSSEWVALLDSEAKLPAVSSDGRTVANIQYTSGTTGSPKGVLLTHRNVLNNAAVIQAGMQLTEQDRICAPVPLYHCFGCVGGALVSVWTGATLVLPGASFDAVSTMEAIQQERATTIYGVPTMFVAQLDHPEFSRFNFSSLRTGVMAGAPCPVEVMQRVVNDMHCPEMTIMYGQTESSPVITMSRVTDSLEHRVRTVGCACANTEVKIIDCGSGETLESGQEGELCTRGYLVMQGYDGEPAATARAVDDQGWLHTGDLAAMREDQYFRVTGRLKDLIIRGGENIYPREVEEFLYTHPKVAEVQVIGVPDLYWGETVVAWVRAREATTAEELRLFCRGKMAHFKIPEHIRFVNEFPMTVTGKVQKFLMRRIEIAERGLEKAAQQETA